jgi:quercetin dioxygenase-like cupin family protein
VASGLRPTAWIEGSADHPGQLLLCGLCSSTSSAFGFNLGTRMDLVTLKRFDTPDETRVLVKGTFELIHVGGMTIGRATYEPGWKWSEHVGPAVGATRCTVEHVGLVISGAATAAFDDGRVVELRAGQAFHIPAVPHDSWVIGDEPYVSLHFLGAERYATK